MSISNPASPEEVSAEILAAAGIACPRCGIGFVEPPPECPGCGYHIGRAGESFPFSPPSLSLVMNPVGLAPDGLEESIGAPYGKLRNTFPQVDVSFCFVKLAPGTPLPEFAFWLFNAAPEPDDARAWHLLVTIEFDSGQISLTPGYAIEPFIDPSEWTANLGAVAMAGSKGKWKEALEIFLHNARRTLCCAWEETRGAKPKKEEPPL